MPFSKTTESDPLVQDGSHLVQDGPGLSEPAGMGQEQD